MRTPIRARRALSLWLRNDTRFAGVIPPAVHPSLFSVTLLAAVISARVLPVARVAHDSARTTRFFYRYANRWLSFLLFPEAVQVVPISAAIFLADKTRATHATFWINTLLRQSIPRAVRSHVASFLFLVFGADFRELHGGLGRGGNGRGGVYAVPIRPEAGRISITLFDGSREVIAIVSGSA